MKNSFWVIILILIAQSIFAQNDSIIVRKEYFSSRAVKTPKIDGVLDDLTWGTAPAINDFKESFPFFGNNPTQQTEVKIVYDNTAIYIAAKLYDTAPDSIAKQLGNRDDELNADHFRIVFDTYNTEQDAFVFIVSASGVQSDMRFSDDLYNAVWESAVKILDDGWSVEMKIPFSALRFPNKEEQVWGLQITRKIIRNGENDQWALTPLGASNFYKYWGLLKGMNHIKNPIRLSLTPYVTSYISHYPTNIVGESNYSKNITGGMDLKYGLNESFTLDATLLPDFTQVQSDNVVKNLSAFEQQFSEQRQFFQEGTDLFQKGNLFYSRRIGRKPSGYSKAYQQRNEKEIVIRNPDQAKLLNAAKISGRTPSGLGVGFLNAVLDNTYATIRDTTNGEERKVLTEPFSNYNLVVFDQQLKNSSSVYLINTNVNRKQNYNHSNVTGVGTQLNNKKNSFRIFGDAIITNILTPDSVKNRYTDLRGHYYNVGVGKTSGNFQFTLSRNAYDPTFNNNDMGYNQDVNYITNRLSFYLYRFKPIRNILNAECSLKINHEENYTTHQLNRLGFSASGGATFKNFHGVYLNFNLNPLERIDYYEARTPGRIFIRTPNCMGSVNYFSDGRKPVSISVNAYGGSTFLISPTIGYNPYYGASINPYIRVNNKLSFGTYNSFHIDDGDRGWVNSNYYGKIVFGVRKLTRFENVISANYLFKNNLSLNLRVRHFWEQSHYKSYYNLREDGYLNDNINYTNNHDYNFNAFNVDMVFQWQFAPGSFINLVWKNIINDESNTIVHSYAENLNNTFNAKQLNNISLKILYYFDYVYLKHKV